MAYLVWGKAHQLSFADEHEYYQALGSLCRRGSYTITFETNSQTESWGDAFRIKCLESDSRTPDAFINAMRNARRINCNDYVQNLYESHDFDFDIANKVLHGDYNKVKRTVPTSYHQDFENGYNLIFTRYSRTGKQTAKASVKNVAQNSLTNKAGKVQSNVTPKRVEGPIINKHEPIRKFTVNIKVGEKVQHSDGRIGRVTSLDDNYITIQFEEREAKFQFPKAFESGFLKKI